MAEDGDTATKVFTSPEYETAATELANLHEEIARLSALQRRNEDLIKENEAKLKENEAKLDRNEKAILESTKLNFDAIKHLTTLSTGSIVLLVTFLEKIFREGQHWRILIGAALICFIFSIVGCVSDLLQNADLITSVALSRNRPLEHFASLDSNTLQVTIRFCFVTFLIGIMSLTVFALRNLY